MERITLATLHEATAQQVFDQAVIGIIEQGGPAINPITERCQYRVRSRACAAGQLMSDDEAAALSSESRNGSAWQTLRAFDLVPQAHEFLITEIQGAHDHTVVCYGREGFMDGFARMAANIALNHNLTVGAMNRALDAQLEPA